MWFRISDVSSGSPARRTIQYRNTEAVSPGNGGFVAMVYHNGSAYFFRLGTEDLFGPYTTAEEAKAKADAVLQPFYIDLP